MKKNQKREECEGGKVGPAAVGGALRLRFEVGGNGIWKIKR